MAGETFMERRRVRFLNCLLPARVGSSRPYTPFQFQGLKGNFPPVIWFSMGQAIFTARRNKEGASNRVAAGVAPCSNFRPQKAVGRLACSTPSKELSQGRN